MAEFLDNLVRFGETAQSSEQSLDFFSQVRGLIADMAQNPDLLGECGCRHAGWRNGVSGPAALSKPGAGHERATLGRKRHVPPQCHRRDAAETGAVSQMAVRQLGLDAAV